MKKLLVLLLSVMMAMSVVACGGDDATTDVEDQQVENDVDANDDAAKEVVAGDSTISEDVVYLELGVDSIENVGIAEMLEISNTAWSFSGGLLDGVEMTQEDLVTVLEQNYSGMFEFVFDEDGVAYMVYGGHTENPVIVTGTYGYNEDGMTVSMAFDINGTTYLYDCFLTQVSDDAGNIATILLALTDMNDFTNALYFVLE